jgi:hypothetical protein
MVHAVAVCAAARAADFRRVSAGLLGLQTFVVRDYGFFAYPLAHFQQECFRHGELPFWDPYNNCGVPFLAQWNTMPLYPPALIYLLLPLQWSLSFFCLLHLWFAGFGMFFLARRWTGNSFAAAFAGVAFAFNGLTLNLLMWPSHIATLSWMPWVVLAVELAWREGGRKIILAAFAGALQMLAGGPEIIFLTWILLLALWIQQFRCKPRRIFCDGGVAVTRFNALAVSAGRGAGDCAGGGATAAVPRSRRPFAAERRLRGHALVHARLGLGEFSRADGFRPHAAPKGMFFQNGQYWTSSYYLGIGTLWLALLAVWTVRERRVRLLGAVAIMALIFALGENTFVYPALRKIIPQLSLMTYPIKYVIFVAFSAPLLAAFALARLFSRSSTKGGVKPRGAPLRGRGEEAETFQSQIPSPQPSPRLGGAREKTPHTQDFQIPRLAVVGCHFAGAHRWSIIFWAWRFPHQPTTFTRDFAQRFVTRGLFDFDRRIAVRFNA